MLLLTYLYKRKEVKGYLDDLKWGHLRLVWCKKREKGFHENTPDQ